MDEDNKQLILSKSQANYFLQCPYKWKRIYIDKVKSEASPAQQRGIRIHSKIEKYYQNMEFDEELRTFIEFENERLESINKEDKLKYFKPIFQELKLQDEDVGIRGICDAVYINPDDEELIVVDYKTGKYYADKFDDYRFELAVYSELLKKSGKIDGEPKYWAILFVDQKRLFFEKIDKKYIEKMYETIKEVRKGIKSGEYLPKKNQYCYWCQFKKECPLMRSGT